MSKNVSDLNPLIQQAFNGSERAKSDLIKNFMPLVYAEVKRWINATHKHCSFISQEDVQSDLILRIVEEVDAITEDTSAALFVQTVAMGVRSVTDSLISICRSGPVSLPHSSRAFVSFQNNVRHIKLTAANAADEAQKIRETGLKMKMCSEYVGLAINGISSVEVCDEQIGPGLFSNDSEFYAEIAMLAKQLSDEERNVLQLILEGVPKKLLRDELRERGTVLSRVQLGKIRAKLVNLFELEIEADEDEMEIRPSSALELVA